MGFIKFLVLVALLAGTAVLGWCVYANWDRDLDADGAADGFSFRVLDPDWYRFGRARAEPLVQYSWERMADMKDEIWGNGGWVDQAEGFLEERRRARAQRAEKAESSPARPQVPTNKAMQDARGGESGDDADEQSSAATTSTAVPETTAAADDAAEAQTAAGTPATAAAARPAVQPAGKSPATQRLEDKIANAEKHFAEGLELYKQADPSRNGWTDESRSRMMEARGHFVQVRELLSDQQTLDLYREAPDRDRALLADADELLTLNQRFLYNATKTSGGL